MLDSRVHGQFFTWTGTASGNFSSASNWLGGVAPSAGGVNNYLLQFNAGLATTYTASNDLGAPFLLNSIVFTSNSTAAVTVANAAANTLEFQGATPGIVQSAFGAVTVSAAFTLNPTSGDFTVTGSGPGAATFSGIISEVGGARQLVLNTLPSVLNAQVIALTGANTYTGGLRLMSGNLGLGNATALGTGVLTIEGGSVQMTAATAVANNVTLNSTMRFIGGTAGTFSGVLSGNGGVIVSGTSAAPLLALTGDNTYTGATTVNSAPILTVNSPTALGELRLAGAAGRIASSTITVRSGGTFTIGDSTTAYSGGNAQGRLDDTAAINLNGGFLNLSSTAAAGNIETVGALTIEGGQNVITVNPGTTAQAQLTFSSLTRGADRGTVFFRGNSIGSAAGNNVANVFFTAAPTLAGGGGGDSSPDISIIRYAFGDRATGSGGATTAGTVGFVTYSATNGVRVLDHTTEYAAGFGAVTGTTNNLLLTASADPTAPVSINSLFVRNSATGTIGIVGDTNTINFPTGNAAAIYSTNALVINTPISFNGNEGLLYSPATGNMTVNGVISGTNGITKVGSGGTLILAGNNTYSGPTTINGGTMVFASTTALGSSNQIVVGGSDAASGTTMGRPGMRYTGATAATLNQDIKLGSGYINVFSGTSTLTLGGTISGPGGLLVNTTGNVVLSGANTYTGMTRIFAGNVVITSDANLGIGGNVDLGATATSGMLLDGNWTTSRQVNISFASQLNTQGFNATLNGPLSGASALTKIGSGKLVLNGSNPNTGSLTISAGTLEVNGSLGPSASVVSIGSTASLAGTGTMFRPVTISGGGTLSPGTSAGTLRMNSLTLSSASNLLFDVGTSTDMVDLDGGTITLPTTGYSLFLGDTTGLAVGNYTLFTYGARTNTLNPTVFNVPAGLKGSFSFGASSGVLTIGILTEYEWAPAGLGSDGSGNWTQGGGNNWQVGASIVDYTTSDDNANIGHGGAAGIISLANGVSVAKIKFQSVSSGVYEIAQGTGSLTVLGGIDAVDADGLFSAAFTVGGANTWNVGAGRTLTLNGVVSGAQGVTKTGTGTVILGAANTFAAGTTINGGFVRQAVTNAIPVGASLTVGSAGAFELNGFDASVGTLAGTGNVTLGSVLTITGGSQTTPTVLSGTGRLSYAPTATSTLTLTGNNSYSGGTVGNGSASFVMGNANALGTGSVQLNNVAASAATITFNTGNATVANDFIMNGLGTMAFTNGANSNQTATLSGQISGGSATQMLRFTGPTDDSSVTRLTNAANNFNFGTVSIFEGQLAISSSAALGNAATIALNTTTGVGSFGGLRLDAENITVAQTMNFVDSNVVNTQANNGTLGGQMVGTGTFGKAGSGRLSITNGTNTHTGTILVNAGELNVRSPGVIATGTNPVTVAAGATISGDGTINRQIIGSAGANIAPGNSIGTLNAGSASFTSTNLNIEINDPSIDKLALTGALALVGSSTLNLSGTPGLGTFDFISFASVSGAGSITLGTAPPAFGYIIGSDADSYFVTIGTADYTWDVNISSTGPQDGAGTWSTGSNFWEGFGSRNFAWVDNPGNVATFGTSGGSGFAVTVTGNKTAKSLSFVQNYTLNGTDTINLADGITANSSATVNAPIGFLASDHTYSVAAGSTLALAQIASDGGAGRSFSKVGTGTLTLNASGHSGNTTISDGLLSTASNTALGNGASSQLNMTGGALLVTGSFAGSQTISLSAASNNISVAPGATLTRNGAIVGGGKLVKLGTGSMISNAASTYSGGTQVEDGVLVAGHAQAFGTATLTVNGGTAKLSPGLGTAMVLPGVSVNLAAGKFDITNSAVAVEYTPADAEPFDSIRAAIVSGYNGGGVNAWTGNGITTSNGNSGQFGIGYAEASALTTIPPIFGSVDATAVLFRYTRYGDADLNAIVNLEDFNRLAANFGAAGVLWSQGDFNYDGAVTLADFNRLAGNFGLAAAASGPTPEDWSALAAAVPEPSVTGLLLTALPLVRRRRRS